MLKSYKEPHRRYQRYVVGAGFIELKLTDSQKVDFFSPYHPVSLAYTAHLASLIVANDHYDESFQQVPLIL